MYTPPSGAALTSKVPETIPGSPSIVVPGQELRSSSNASDVTLVTIWRPWLACHGGGRPATTDRGPLEKTATAPPQGDPVAGPLSSLAEQFGQHPLMCGEHPAAVAAEPPGQLVGAAGREPCGLGGVVGAGDGGQYLDWAEVGHHWGGDHPGFVGLPGVGDDPGRSWGRGDVPGQGQAGFLGQLADRCGDSILAGVDVPAGQRPTVPVVPLDHEQPPLPGAGGGGDYRVGGLRFSPVTQFASAVSDAGGGGGRQGPAVDYPEGDGGRTLPLLPVDAGWVSLG